jgi:hypothetical protein
MPSNLPSPKKVSSTEHASMTAIGSAMPAQLAAFAHATLFSPALSTLGLALKKGYLTNFPGLTAKTLRKYPPQSFPMVKGHLDQTRKNLASTKQKPESANTKDGDGNDDVFPTSTSSGERSHHCYATIMEPTGQIYTDQTGCFAQASSNGNNYLLILYDCDSNSILAEPLKTQTGQAIQAAYKILHTKLCNAGFCPKL